MDHCERGVGLDQVLIGGRERREIVIAEYDPGWPRRFELERERVRGALGSTALGIEHIGSTAVLGLAAKPIVDVLVTVRDPDSDPSIVAALEAAGYQLRVRERGHRMFRTPGRDVHIHVWAGDDPEVGRYLAFRDQLRRSPSDRVRYERLKRQLSERDWSDVNDYADAKSELISAILAKTTA